MEAAATVCSQHQVGETESVGLGHQSIGGVARDIADQHTNTLMFYHSAH